MSISTRTGLFLALQSTAIGTAIAVPVVLQEPPPANPSETAQVTLLPDGRWRIGMFMPSGNADTRFTVIAPPPDVLEEVLLYHNTTGIGTLRIVGDAVDGAVTSVSRIRVNDGPAPGKGRAVLEFLRASGDIGPVDIGAVERAVIDGSITGRWDISSGGGYPAFIDDLFVGQDVRANVGCVSIDGPGRGRFGSIFVGGTIGTPSQQVSISADGPIGSISASAIYADLRTDASFGTFSPANSIRARSGPIVGQVIVGSLVPNSSNANPQIFAAGDIDADILVRGEVRATEGFPLGASIASGGSLRAGRTITIVGSMYNEVSGFNGGIAIANPQGLQGNIVLNALDSAPLPWARPVTIGATSLLAQPEYSITPSTLGGGAIGQSPLRQYPLDTTFAELGSAGAQDNFGLFLDSTIRQQFAPSAPAATRVPLHVGFYGPVFVAANSRPFKAELFNESGTNSIDVSHLFTARRSTTNSRWVEIVGLPNTNYFSGRYRFTYLDGAEGAPRIRVNLQPFFGLGSGVVMSQPLIIDVGRDANIDANGNYAGNGELDILEIARLCADTNGNGVIDDCNCPDKNGNGIIDGSPAEYCVADLAGPDPSNPGAAIPTPDGFVDDLDFTIFQAAYNELYDWRGDMNGDSITDDADFQLFILFYDKLDCLEQFPMKPCGS